MVNSWNTTFVCILLAFIISRFISIKSYSCKTISKLTIHENEHYISGIDRTVRHSEKVNVGCENVWPGSQEKTLVKLSQQMGLWKRGGGGLFHKKIISRFHTTFRKWGRRGCKVLFWFTCYIERKLIFTDFKFKFLPPPPLFHKRWWRFMGLPISRPQ